MSKRKALVFVGVMSLLMLGNVAHARRFRRGKGRIAIKTVPPARVFMKGRLKGRTPLKLNAPARRHTILLKAPGYKAMRVTVRVRPGRTTKVFRKLIRKRPRMARLSVHSAPRAKVFLNGKLIGRTPMVNRRTPPGRHRLRLVSPRGRVWKRWVVLRPGVPTRVNHKYPPLVRFAKIKVNATPRAKVFLDGKYIGKTPLIRGKIRPGRHTIMLKKPGFHPVSRAFVARPGRVTNVVKRLRPKKRMGWLIIKTRPRAKVYLDGKYVGWSPIRRLKTTPGRHQLRFVSRTGRRRKRMTVRVVAGRGTRINTVLGNRRGR